VKSLLHVLGTNVVPGSVGDYAECLVNVFDLGAVGATPRILHSSSPLPAGYVETHPSDHALI